MPKFSLSISALHFDALDLLFRHHFDMCFFFFFQSFSTHFYLSHKSDALNILIKMDHLRRAMLNGNEKGDGDSVVVVIDRIDGKIKRLHKRKYEKKNNTFCIFFFPSGLILCMLCEPHLCVCFFFMDNGHWLVFLSPLLVLMVQVICNITISAI